MVDDSPASGSLVRRGDSLEPDSPLTLKNPKMGNARLARVLDLALNPAAAPTPGARFRPWFSLLRYTTVLYCSSSQVYRIHKQQTTIRQPIECAPEASRGGRERAEMTERFHLVDLT